MTKMTVPQIATTTRRFQRTVRPHQTRKQTVRSQMAIRRRTRKRSSTKVRRKMLKMVLEQNPQWHQRAEKVDRRQKLAQTRRHPKRARKTIQMANGALGAPTRRRRKAPKLPQRKGTRTRMRIRKIRKRRKRQIPTRENQQHQRKRKRR